LVWIEFSPQAGHEQAGRRPALVLSPRIFNSRTSLAFVCPITSKVKGYAFQVPLPDELPVHGVVLCEHLRSVDWKARKASRLGHVSEDVLQTIREVVGSIAGISL
jgi:mRNA interferase MazF